MALTRSVPMSVALYTSPNAPSPIFYHHGIEYISKSVALEYCLFFSLDKPLFFEVDLLLLVLLLDGGQFGSSGSHLLAGHAIVI